MLHALFTVFFYKLTIWTAWNLNAVCRLVEYTAIWQTLRRTFMIDQI